MTALSVSLLSGCGAKLFTDRKADPIVQAKVGNLDVAANTAVRRNVYVRLDDAPIAGTQVRYGGGYSRLGGYRGEFCAEPPPEALEALVSTFGAKVNAGNGTKSLDGEFAKALATAVQSNFRRSQGIQYYRDVSFTLCTAMINGFIPAAEYIQQLYRIRTVAAELMKEEFRTGAWKTPVTQTVVEPRVIFADPIEGETKGG